MHSTRTGLAFSAQSLMRIQQFGTSILLRTMSNSTLDKPWHHTYAWTDQFDSVHLLDGLTSHDMHSQNDSISISQWNVRPHTSDPSWRSQMVSHQHPFDCSPQKSFVQILAMDCGHIGTLTCSHQLQGGLLSTQGVLCIHNGSNTARHPISLPQTAGSFPLVFTKNQLALP